MNCDQPHTLARSAGGSFASELSGEADNNEWVSGLLRDDQCKVNIKIRQKMPEAPDAADRQAFAAASAPPLPCA